MKKLQKLCVFVSMVLRRLRHETKHQRGRVIERDDETVEDEQCVISERPRMVRNHSAFHSQSVSLRSTPLDAKQRSRNETFFKAYLVVPSVVSSA